MPQSATVLQLEVEAVGLPQLYNCRRGKGECQTVLYLGKCCHCAAGDGRRLKVRGRAQFPVLEPDKGKPHVLASASKTEACDRNDRLHRLLLVFKEMMLQLFDHSDGPLLGGAGRELDLAYDEPLVLVGEECCRKMQEKKAMAATMAP